MPPSVVRCRYPDGMVQAMSLDTYGPSLIVRARSAFEHARMFRELAKRRREYLAEVGKAIYLGPDNERREAPDA